MLDALHTLPFRVARWMTYSPVLARLLGIEPDEHGQALQAPAHVQATLLRDVDVFDLPGGKQSIHRAWKRVQDENPDIFFTPRHGGYWVLTRGQLIAEAFSDPGLFSSHDAIGIPRLPKFAPPMLPIASDQPAHTAFRQPINLALSPRAMQSLTAEARELAVQLIEGFQARGHCDFGDEFAAYLPISVFMRMVNLPLSDREYLMGLTERSVHGRTAAIKTAAALEIFEYLDGRLRQRRREPGADVLSKIMQIQVGDRPITHKEALGEAAQVLFGGLDTVAATMGFIAHYLATHPEQTRLLVEQPDRIPAAVDELVRRHTLPVFARRLTRDTVFHGVAMKENDQVIIPVCLHSLDDRLWADPLTVDFDRKTTDHVGFGKGIHKCPGANLARAEIRIFLEEWLKRIPSFSLKLGCEPENIGGQVVGIRDVQLVWPT